MPKCIGHAWKGRTLHKLPITAILKTALVDLRERVGMQGKRCG